MDISRNLPINQCLEEIWAARLMDNLYACQSTDFKSTTSLLSIPHTNYNSLFCSKLNMLILNSRVTHIFFFPILNT